MKKYIKDFFEKVKKMGKVKGIFYFVILMFVALTVFSNFAFSSREFFNKINNLIQAVLVLLIFVYILVYSSFKFDFFFVLLVSFNIVVMISSALSGFVNFRYTTLILCVVAFFLYQFLICENNRRDTVNVMLLGSLGFIAYFILVYHTEILTFDFSLRLGEYFDDQNYVGRYFLFIYIFFLYYVIVEKKYYMLPIAFVSLYLMATTGSISSLLSAALITILFFWFIIPKGKKYILLLSVLGAAIAGFLLLQLAPLQYFKERIYGIITLLLGNSGTGSDESTEFRLKVAIEAFYMFLKRPLFGYGFFEVASYSSFHIFSHNNITELLADHGLIATILFEILVTYPVLRSSKSKSDHKILYIGLMSSIILFQFFLVTYYSKFEYLVFALVYAFIYDSRDKQVAVSAKINLKIGIENTALKLRTKKHA